MAPPASVAMLLFPLLCRGSGGGRDAPWLRSPPMGWNPCMGTYGGVKVCGGKHPPSENLVLSVADALQRTGLAHAGYTMLELDDGWPAAERDNATGEIVADPRLFPSGVAAVVAQLGAMDPPLHFGLYTDRGATTCGGKPGSGGHEAQDAATYIKWGVRQVKSDSCAAPGEHEAALAQYKLMQDALDRAPAERPVFFGLCGWWNWYGAAGPKAGVGNSYRLATDCVGYEQMLLNADAAAGVAEFLEPGRWPDMDMISAADRGPNGLQDAARVQTQFSLIAVTGAVLLISFDVRNEPLNREYIRIVNNSEIIAVHQDPPRGPGYFRRLWGAGMARSMAYPLTGVDCGAAAVESQWTFVTNESVPGGHTGAFESRARPGWCLQTTSGNGPNKCGGAAAAVMPCGDAVLGARCGPIGQWTLGPNGSVSSVYAGASALLTGDEYGVPGGLWFQPRFPDADPRAALQRWRWDAAAGQLRSPGGCAGAAAAPPRNANVWGRALSGGAWALVFVNAEASAARAAVPCAWVGCMERTGFAASARLRIRDLVRHTDVGEISAGDGYTASSVAGAGGSDTLLFSPIA